ncbi:hypothetical protein ACHWQZ_G008372 [Mnemiopsis leidyi]
MDVFNDNGLTWYFTNDITRRRLVKDTLQESLLDQVLYTNDALVNGCEIVSPLGRSDHVGIMLDLVVSPSTDTRVKQKVLKPIWGKVSSEKLLNISINDIDWDYCSTNNVQDMWAELLGKLEAVAATVPAASVYLDNRPVKLPWSTTALKRMRKNKDRAWAEFDIDPTDINFSIAISKQHTFEEEEFKAKIKYEKKITSNLKQNCKVFYAYLRNKRQVKSSIVSLDRGDGTRTDTTAESAEVLATAFSSVFVREPPGPLPKNESLEVNECVIDDMVIRSSDVKKQLLKLNIFKSSGPDGVHPKLLKSLANDDRFVEAVTQLYVKCSETGILPEIWKSASVVALFKKGSKSDPLNYRPVSLTCILCKYWVQLWNPVATHGNWATVLELESVQRRFTRLIDEVGTLPYSRRLEILNLTTLAERRICGDLIEAFKATSGLTEYGQGLFRMSRSGLNLVSSNRCCKSATKVRNVQSSFLPERVIPFWNKLPSEVKNSTSVLNFKIGLESFKKERISKNEVNVLHYWNVSSEVVGRIEGPNYVINKEKHNEYLLSHPFVAKNRFINLSSTGKYS